MLIFIKSREKFLQKRILRNCFTHGSKSFQVLGCKPHFQGEGREEMYIGVGTVHCSVGMKDPIPQQKSQQGDLLLWGC